MTAALLAGAIIAAAGCTGNAQQTTAAKTAEAPVTAEAASTTAAETTTTAEKTTAEQETTTAAASEAETTPNGSGITELDLTVEEFRELNHKIFLANQQETMFERHSTLTVRFTNDFSKSSALPTAIM